ncbi:MAG TPA: hypothetical protein VGD67_25830, partial [Pseudonocardiaceae bacterium]
MPRSLPGPFRRRRLFAAAAAAVAAALVAGFLTQAVDNDAAASPAGPVGPADVPSAGEVAAGLVAVAQEHPGGLPGLLGLFESGACAGAESYEAAPPECRSTLDRIRQAGSGQSFPDTLPVAPPVSGPVPPEAPHDPADGLTAELVEQLRRHGAPQDLIDGLSQDPPYVPPRYRFQGGAGGT